MYYMWFDMYDGKIRRIGKAYSNDGLNWKKFKKSDKTAVILDIGKKNKWDDKLIHCPEVYLWNNKYHMLYGAKGTGHINYNTGLAIQKDINSETFKKWGQVTTDEMFGNEFLTFRLQAGIIINGIMVAGLRIKCFLNSETTYMVFSDDGGKSWNKLTGSILKKGRKNEWDSTLYYGPNCWVVSENKLWCVYLAGERYDIRRLGLAYMKKPNIGQKIL